MKRRRSTINIGAYEDHHDILRRFAKSLDRIDDIDLVGVMRQDSRESVTITVHLQRKEKKPWTSRPQG
jgi:hypothetical protein